MELKSDTLIHIEGELDPLSMTPTIRDEWDYTGIPLILRTLPKGYSTPYEYSEQKIGPELFVWNPSGKGDEVMYTKNVVDEGGRRFTYSKGEFDIIVSLAYSMFSLHDGLLCSVFVVGM
jgi:hypothetical protein